MSLSHKSTIVNIHDRRDRNSTNQGGLGRSGSSSGGGTGRGAGGAGGGIKGGGPKGPKGPTLPPLPPLRPWDGSFPFDLIREITSPDLDPVTQIPKYDYYRAAHDTPKISLYQVPCYLIDHVNDLAVISPRKSHSRDAMFCAGALYGATRFYASEEYNALAVQYTRYTHSKLLLSPEDCTDVSSLLASIKLREDNCGSGWKRQISYRVPEHVKVQLLPDSSALRLSLSSLLIRFYMDALREQRDDLHPCHLSAMNQAVDGDLYPKIGRVAWKLEALLDSLKVEPAEPAD